MNQKKLIGTIIGIIFFVVLIAGATFAWLSATATVTMEHTMYLPKTSLLITLEAEQSVQYQYLVQLHQQQPL